MKKMIMLASMALAIVAFAAPAAAQANGFWKTDDGVTLGSASTAVDFAGVLTFSGGGLQITCDVHGTGTLDNNETGTGQIEEFNITANTCKLNVPACEVAEASTDTTTPWPVMVASTTEADIEEANFFNKIGNGAGCKAAGIAGLELNAEAVGATTATDIGGGDYEVEGAFLVNGVIPGTVEGEIEITRESDGTAIEIE